MLHLTLALLLAAAQAATPAMPMADSTSCPAQPAPLPADYAGWSAMVPLTAARTTNELALAVLPLGRSARATLAPVAGVAFPTPPEHAPAAGTYAGLFAVTVTQAGRYRVALGGGPWIDMVKDGRALTSVEHGHGPACTGVRKQVEFDLEPGRHVLQVSGATAPVLALMIARVAD